MEKNGTWFKNSVSTLLLSFGFFLITHVYSQRADSTKTIKRFGGAVTVTNNGISLLPTFSLGKPAVMFDMLVGSKRLSFEPQFRFSLEGKPWSFIFWWRYKLLNNDKFRINVGAHPAIAFKTVPVLANRDSTETIERIDISPENFLRIILSQKTSVSGCITCIHMDLMKVQKRVHTF